MSDNKRIAKNTFYLYVRMLLIMGVYLYISRIIIKILGIEDFGIFNVVGGLVSIFTFLNGSLGGATSRYITFELGKKNYLRLNQVFNAAVIIHCCLAVILFILAESIGLWFLYSKMQIPEYRMTAAFYVYQCSIFTAILSLLQIPYVATIIAYENMSVYAYVGVFEALLRLSVVFVMQWIPMDYMISYALLLCVLQLFIFVFYYIYCNRKYEVIDLKLYKEWKLYREMFGYACSDLIGNISVLAQGQGLNILLNMFFGPVVNAARAIVYQVQGAIMQFSANFMTAVKPQIIKLYANGDIKGMMELVINSSCFSYYLMLIISLPLLLESDYILTLWLDDYPDITKSFLHLIIILCLIQSIKTPRTTVYHATGHLKLTNIVVGSILCSAFPIAYVLLRLGCQPESVFWAAIFTMVISEVASIIILKRYVDYSVKEYVCTVHLRCIIVSIVSLIVPLMLYDYFFAACFLRLLLTIFISTISVIVSGYYLGVNKETRTKIKLIIRERFINGKFC